MIRVEREMRAMYPSAAHRTFFKRVVCLAFSPSVIGLAIFLFSSLGEIFTMRELKAMFKLKSSIPENPYFSLLFQGFKHFTIGRIGRKSHAVKR